MLNTQHTNKLTLTSAGVSFLFPTPAVPSNIRASSKAG